MPWDIKIASIVGDDTMTLRKVALGSVFEAKISGQKTSTATPYLRVANGVIDLLTWNFTAIIDSVVIWEYKEHNRVRAEWVADS